MKTFLVVTITCPDRTGIVERITQVAIDHGANWEDSRMARLGGDFAGIVMISVEDQEAEALTKALLGLIDDSTTVSVKRTDPQAASIRQEAGLFWVTLTGADHEGIVHKVSAFLAGQGINVEAMDTHVSRAPMSGSPLFHMEAKIKVPAGVEIAELAENLRHVGEDLGVDLELRPADGEP